jgi:hypothetical protein
MCFQILVVWVVKRCGFVSEYRRFGGTCDLRHQRRSKQVADVLRCAGRLPGLIGSSCLRRTSGRPWTSVGSTSDLLQKAFHPQVSSRQWGWHQWKGTFFPPVPEETSCASVSRQVKEHHPTVSADFDHVCCFTDVVSVAKKKTTKREKWPDCEGEQAS